MSVRLRFILYMILMHGLMLVLGYYFWRENVLYFILWECVVLISICLAAWLFKSMITPLNFLTSGKNALVDKDFTVKFNKTGTREMDALINVYNDMIDRLRAERTQQESQHYFLEKLVEASPTGLIILDFDGQIKQINGQAMSFLDHSIIEELIGQNIYSLKNSFLTAVSQVPEGESRMVKLNGVNQYKCQKAAFIDQGFKRHFITISEVSSEILESEKSAYGKVIRMMAHEVNNSLGAINSMLQSLSEMTVKGDAQEQDDYKMAMDVAINRNRRLTRFVRNFADIIKLPPPDMQKIDLTKAVGDAANLMRAKATLDNIEITFDAPDLPVFIMGDMDQLELIFINIFKNAIESIGANGSIRCHLNGRTLEISDTGKGIPMELETNLFTPFFSTKTNGQGIGLTLTREILLSHGATFSLKTKGDWTTFKILF